jgi:D-inositol-3-phosphate glycosyltransferase
VEHGETGLLVPPKDSEELAKAVISLLNNSDLRRRMSQAINERIHTRLSWVEKAKQTIAVYERVLKQRRNHYT